jgi:type I restriction enzyme S subunit
LERVNAEQNKNIGKKYEVAIPKTNLVQRLPAEWDLAPLGNLVADSVLGIVVPISRQNKKAEGITYIKMNNITSNGDLDLTNIVYVQVNGGDINKYQLEKGDVLFNTRNSYELVGKTSIVKNVEKPMVFNNNIMRIRLVEGIDPFFVTYQMNSPTFRGLMMREKKATTNICALYKKDLFPLPIVVAPVAEQHKIVEEIERCISVVDETEKVSKRSFQQSERLRQSILRDAFEGKLVPQDPNDESADKLLESIKAECISNKKSKGDKQVELSRYVK